MRKQRPLIRLYTDDTTTLEQALASGELVAAMTWDASAVQLKTEGVPVTFAKPKEAAHPGPWRHDSSGRAASR